MIVVRWSYGGWQVRVIARIRPSPINGPGSKGSPVVIPVGLTDIQVVPPAYDSKQKHQARRISLDKVFGAGSTQEQLFSEVTDP